MRTEVRNPVPIMPSAAKLKPLRGMIQGHDLHDEVPPRHMTSPSQTWRRDVCQRQQRLAMHALSSGCRLYHHRGKCREMPGGWDIRRWRHNTLLKQGAQKRSSSSGSPAGPLDVQQASSPSRLRWLPGRHSWGQGRSSTWYLPLAYKSHFAATHG